MESNVAGNPDISQQNEPNNATGVDNTISEQISYSQSSTVSVDVAERVQSNENTASSQNSSATATSTAITRNSSSEGDERPHKKPKLDETVADEGSLCVICYEIWGQTDDHRICSLKCGHLFGHKCILRWLGENKVCPTCKKHSTKRDIRFIYANKLIALDTGELIRLQTELDKAKSAKKDLEIEVTSVMCKLAMVNADLDKCKAMLQDSMSRSKIAAEQAGSHAVEKSFRLKNVSEILVCPQGSCRVMDYISSKSSIVASLKSPNNLFPGFGVKHFHSERLTTLSYIPLHSKVIRDLQFNQSNARLLSVSLDKHFSIANLYSARDTTIKECCDDMLWSCCWDATNSNIFYVGGQQGSVKIYDSRYLSATAIATHSIEGDLSPVVSIASIPSAAGGPMPRGGFIVCKLNSLWAFENTARIPTETPTKHLLPLEGPFVSMTYNECDKHLLVSARPNANESAARQIICNLHRDGSVLSCNRVHTFATGKLQKQLTRSCFLNMNGLNYVASPNNNTVQLWNSQTGFPVTDEQLSTSIIDLMPMKNNRGTHLLALTEKKLNIHKIIEK